MTQDEYARAIAELNQDVQEVEGSLHEKLSGLRQSNKQALDFHNDLLAWLVRVTRVLLDAKMIVNPKTGTDLRPQLKAELDEIIQSRLQK